MTYRVLALAACAASFVGTASAQIVNGSFEQSGGSFTGWSVKGDTLIEGNSLGSGPTDSTHEALVATATDGSVNNAVPAGTGVSESVLDPFLGLSASALTGLGNGTVKLGSAITQSVTLAAGQKLTFDWDFLTNQTYYDALDGYYQKPSAANNDFAFVSVSKAGSINLTKLADTFDGYAPASNAGGFVTAFTITDINDPFISETGFHSYTFTAATAGTYTLGVGAVNATTNANTDGINSAVLVDNFKVLPVPEPQTYVGFAFIGAMAWNRRRRSSTRS